MNIHDEEFKKMAYFILFLVCLIMITLLITIASYLCTIPTSSSTQPPSQPLGVHDTNSNQTTITVMEPADQQQHQPRLEQSTTNVCRSNDQIRTIPYLSEVKLCNSNNINSISSCCCSICLMDYKESDLLRMLPGCGHLFHVACVDPWLIMKLTCPVCRKTYRSV